MSPGARDEFTQGVKEVLAKRVAERCSQPDCDQVTGGPHSQPNKAINLGVAAHITAAAPGGPRYDSTLTPAERADHSNGIWLCQHCAKLIDSDPTRYTAELLRKWKSAREQEMTAASERRDPRNDVPLVPPALLVESVSDSANRLARELYDRQKRERLLSQEGGRLAVEDAERVFEALEAIHLESSALGWQLHRGQGRTLRLGDLGVHLSWENPFLNTSDEGRMFLRLMKGAPYNGLNPMPTVLESREFKYCLSPEKFAGCWIEQGRRRIELSNGEVFSRSNSDLADEAAKMLLDEIKSRARSR